MKTKLHTSVILVLCSLSSFFAHAISNPNFSVAPNGITCLCSDAAIGETGELTINGVTQTYTKRTRAQLDALIAADQNDPQIALTCTSGITDMSELFFEKTQFNQDISTWDVSNVTNMSKMFQSASSFDQALNNWDVSGVLNMSDMFRIASSFNQSLDAWDVSSVTDMSGMFRIASSFNQDISTWCVEQIATEPNLFSIFSALQANFKPNWGAACFYVGDNGVTCFCPDVSFGDTGQLTINGVTQTYTKRTRAQLDALIVADQNDPQIALTCTSGITDMSELFFDKTQFNQDISTWDVSNVTDMNSMFSAAASFNQPLNNWDVSSVTNMSGMFFSTNSFNQPLNDWDVSSVSEMGAMFLGANSFNQPLDDWDVSSVTNMNFMFFASNSFNQDISTWCVQQIAGEPFNFSSAPSFQANFKPNWGAACFYVGDNGVTCFCPDANFGDTGQLTINGVTQTYTKRTRAQLDALIDADQNDPQIALTCTSGITDMSNLFSFKNQFNQDISTWDVSNVTNMFRMFQSASSFDQALNDWDVSNVTNMFGMFQSASSFNQPLNAWDVSKVTNMAGMFSGADQFNQPLNDWDVSNVTNMRLMFQGADQFNQPLNDWDVTNVTDMIQMFDLADSFNQPLNDWDVSNVTGMAGMFRRVSSFNQPLNDWDVSNVTDMVGMFEDATSFNQDISTWCVEQIAAEPSIFSIGSPLQASFKPVWGESCVDLIWTGIADNNWNNTANWSTNALPLATDKISINTQDNQPFIDENTQAEINHLIVENGNTVEVLGNLKVNADLRNDGQLIFKSNATQTGQLDEFTGTYSGTGTVEVERFIPAGDNEKRAFRFVSSSVNSTENIRANWQEGVNNTGTIFPTDNQNPNPGFGTHITGSLTGANGFDASGSGNPSLFLFNPTSQLWNAIANTNVNTLEVGKGYRLMVRGDRGINLTSNGSEPSNTVLRAKGDLVFGPVDVSTDLAQGADEFSLVGNPYQAVIDFSSAIKTNLRDYVYVWDATLTGNNGRGAYVVVEVSSNNIVEAPDPSSSSATKFIAPNQAFFVRNTSAGNPTLIFNEANKATDETQVEVFGSYTDFYINSRLYKAEDLLAGNTEVDAIGLRFNPNYTTLASEEDAEKIANPDENYAIINNGLRSIDKQDLPTDGHEIELLINSYTSTAYSLTFDMDNLTEGISVFLNDAYLNTQTQLSLHSTYDFTVDANIPQSMAFNRFSLSFGTTTLGVEENVLSSFSLYPNPTEDGTFTIQTQGFNMDKVVVKIHNLLGQEVFNQKAAVQANGEIRIHAGQLPSGMYMVELQENEQRFVGKLMVR